ncbi:hypothetical protein CMEL01_16774, partial [Colletotrichum melonis]
VAFTNFLIPYALYRASKSAYNTISSIIIIVTPSAKQNANNINNKLLLPPIPKT